MAKVNIGQYLTYPSLLSLLNKSDLIQKIIWAAVDKCKAQLGIYMGAMICVDYLLK